MTVAIISIVCCWIISFFFNGIESGLLSIDPVRLRQNVKRRVPAALQLNGLLKHPERVLATVLLITNAADIVALLLLTSQLFRWYGYAGFLFALIIALPVYLFVLSVLPKSLFRRFPFRALARLAGVLKFTSILFSPLLELGARHRSLGRGLHDDARLKPRRRRRRRRRAALRERVLDFVQKLVTDRAAHRVLGENALRLGFERAVQIVRQPIFKLYAQHL